MKSVVARQFASLSRWVVDHAAFIVVGIAVLAGAILRFVRLGSVPPGLFVDEAVNGYNAYSILLTGRDHHGHFLPLTGIENFGEWASPLLTFLLIPFIGVFGLHPEVLRVVTALIGVAAIPIVYLLGVTLAGRRIVGVAAACLIAVSPQHVHLSRWAIPPSLVPTMVALTLLLVIWSVRRRSDRGIIATALVAGLTVSAYSAMKLYIPLLGLATILLFSAQAAWIRTRTLLVAGAILAIVAGPPLLRTAFGAGATRFQQVSAFQEPGFGVGTLVENYLSFFSPSFLFVMGDGNPTHTPPGFGFELRTVAPLLVIGLVWLVFRAVRPGANSDRTPLVFFLIALLLYPIPGSLTINNPHTLRAAHLIPLLAVLAGMGFAGAVDAARWLVRNQSPTLARGIPIVVTALAVLALGMELRVRYIDYFGGYPAKIAMYFEYGLEDVLRYVNAHTSEHDNVLMAEINQGYIYVLFYEKTSPTTVQQTLQVRRNPPDFNYVDAFGKYRFVGLRERPPRNLPGNSLGVLHSVQYPDGRTAFEVTGWVAGDGKRTLLIWKP